VRRAAAGGGIAELQIGGMLRRQVRFESNKRRWEVGGTVMNVGKGWVAGSSGRHVTGMLQGSSGNRYVYVLCEWVCVCV